MKKVLILIFIFMAVFILPTFASPTGGGDSVISSFVDADFSVTESQVEPINTEINFVFIENVFTIKRPTIRMLSRMSAMKTNMKLKAVEELMLKKTTVNELSGNLIRYVRLAA